MTLPRSKPESSPDFIDRNDDSAADPVRIALAGRHELFVDVLIDALLGMGMTAWWVPGDSTSDVLAQLQERRAHLVLLNLDSKSPPELAIDLIGQLAQCRLPVIVLGVGHGPAGLYPFLAAGALTVIDKVTADFDELAEAIRMAVEGDVSTVRDWQLKLNRQLRSTESRLQRRLAPFESLTLREQEVMELICQGLAASEIAQRSYLSITTTRSHISAILHKLGVHSQLAAAANAYDSGWYQARVHSHPNHQN